MACPYFIPSESLGWRDWPGRMRPPLGEYYAGCCAAGRSRSDELPLEACNQGYPQSCSRFPTGGPHAVRFAVASRSEQTLRVRWSLERDHRPLEWGEVSWTAAGLAGLSQRAGQALRKQLEAYVASYLRLRAGG